MHPDDPLTCTAHSETYPGHRDKFPGHSLTCTSDSYFYPGDPDVYPGEPDAKKGAIQVFFSSQKRPPKAKKRIPMTGTFIRLMFLR